MTNVFFSPFTAVFFCCFFLLWNKKSDMKCVDANHLYQKNVGIYQKKKKTYAIIENIFTVIGKLSKNYLFIHERGRKKNDVVMMMQIFFSSWQNMIYIYISAIILPICWQWKREAWLRGLLLSTQKNTRKWTNSKDRNNVILQRKNWQTKRLMRLIWWHDIKNNIWD